MPLAKPLTKQQIEKAQQATRSNRAAARYLSCSYNHYKRYAKMYTDNGGKTLFEKHLNPSGKGISKWLNYKGKKEPPLMELLEGKLSRKSYSIERIKSRLLNEVLLKSECYKCGHHEKRASDLRQPLLLNFKDKNKNNLRLENLEILCYNCYYLYVDEVFNAKQIQYLEDGYAPNDSVKPTFDFEDWQLEHFRDLDDVETRKEEDDDDEYKYVSRV